MHREIAKWDELIQRFKIKIDFQNESPLVGASLQAIRNNIFSVEGLMDIVPVSSAYRSSMIVHEIMECYNVGKEY